MDGHFPASYSLLKSHRVSPNFHVLSDQSVGVSDILIQETQVEHADPKLRLLNQKSSHNIKVVQELFTEDRSVQSIHPTSRT